MQKNKLPKRIWFYLVWTGTIDSEIDWTAVEHITLIGK